MKVLITGSKGFIAKNLRLFLKERNDIEVYNFSKESDNSELDEIINKVDFIFHLAGINRSSHQEDFVIGNENLTRNLCKIIKKINKKIPILFSSTIQATLDNPYGASKYNAEKTLINFSKDCGIPIYIFRLPNVFGKWCKPNYNSVVATFCYNISRNIPIHINDPDSQINLVYIDDVIKEFIKVMDNKQKKLNLNNYQKINPIYKVTVADLAKQLNSFREMRNSYMLERVGTGFKRALYSTYVSYLTTEQFSYQIKAYNDTRGSFVEMLKTPDCGQFSCFTILPNITRGNHYHHSKTEKFLVIKGHALFKFLNLDTNETYEIKVNSDKPEIVESITGWAHNITNIGDQEMTVMLWSNEIFDPLNPDTISYKI